MTQPEDVAAVAEFIATVSVLSKNCADIVHWSMEADALRAVARELERLYAIEAAHEALLAKVVELESVQCTASLGPRGRCTNRATVRYRTRYVGTADRWLARCDLHELWPHLAVEPIDAASRGPEGEG